MMTLVRVHGAEVLKANIVLHYALKNVYGLKKVLTCNITLLDRAFMCICGQLKSRPVARIGTYRNFLVLGHKMY